jgi:hypothetical protein
MSQSQISFNGARLGTAFSQLMLSDDIETGTMPSYQLCKLIFLFHPLGGKMASGPIVMAQSQKREISVKDSPGDRVKDAFIEQWRKMRADQLVMSVATQARIYGVCSLALGALDVPADQPIDYTKLPDLEIFFNVEDPLNTAGSLVLNQNPNAPDFQKKREISVSGTPYHRSRTVTLMNEQPIYLAYTSSAFGYSGRSVYQRALYPLKSFVSTMIADDLVARKAGVLIAKLQQPGSVIDNVMGMIAGVKRNLLKEAENDNVISIGLEEAIESLDLHNVDAPLNAARTHILENIAVAADMPAKLLNSETFVAGFGEGTEDAKNVARYVDLIREWLEPVYEFLDQICMYRAWTPEFFKTLQADFPDLYGKMDYRQAFYTWKNSFRALWPNLLTEPDSEKVTVEDVKFKAIIAVAEVLLPMLDPENKVLLLQWLQDNFNSNELLFETALNLDAETLVAWQEKQADQAQALQAAGGDEPAEGGDAPEREPKEPAPFAKAA